MLRLPTLLLLTFLCTCVRAQKAWSVFRYAHAGQNLDLPAAIMAATNTPDVAMVFDNGAIDSTFAASTNDVPLATNTLFPVNAASAAPVCVTGST